MIEKQEHGPCVLCGEHYPEQAGVRHPDTGKFICCECVIMANGAIQLRVVNLICELKAAWKKGDDGK